MQSLINLIGKKMFYKWDSKDNMIEVEILDLYLDPSEDKQIKIKANALPTKINKDWLNKHHPFVDLKHERLKDVGVNIDTLYSSNNNQNIYSSGYLCSIKFFKFGNPD